MKWILTLLAVLPVLGISMEAAYLMLYALGQSHRFVTEVNMWLFAALLFIGLIIVGMIPIFFY